MPIFFDKAAETKVYQSVYKDSMQNVQNAYNTVQLQKQEVSIDFIKTNDEKLKTKIQSYKQKEDSLRTVLLDFGLFQNNLVLRKIHQ